MYLRYTRIDLLHAIHMLSKIVSKPRRESEKALKHVLGYLQLTKNYERTFYNKENKNKVYLLAFTDSEWACNRIDRKSISGNLIYFGSTLVTGKSKTQKTIATSAASAELMEIYNTCKTLVSIKHLCNEIDVKTEQIPVILTDSLSSVQTLGKPVSELQKHLSVYIHFLKENIQNKMVKVVFVNRSQNIADIQTKQGTKKEFQSLWKAAQEPLTWKHIVLDKETNSVMNKSKNSKQPSESNYSYS